MLSVYICRHDLLVADPRQASSIQQAHTTATHVRHIIHTCVLDSVNLVHGLPVPQSNKACNEFSEGTAYTMNCMKSQRPKSQPLSRIGFQTNPDPHIR